MRDGINLSANILFPEGKGPFPVLLNRTPYSKDTALRFKNSQIFVKAGYIVIHMDVRGRGDSEGTFNPYFQEINDGHDSLEWAGTQEWSSGKVGTFGGSYEGWTQIYPTRLRSAYHKAAFLMCTPSMHPFHEGPYRSGIPAPIMGMWSLFTSGKSNKAQMTELDWEDAVKTRPLIDLMPSLGIKESMHSEYAKHETMDEFWHELWPDDNIVYKTKIPCYHVTGWFDDNQKGTLDHFPHLAIHHPDPDVRKTQRLLIGPWPHRLSADTGKLGDFDYGSHSMVPLFKEAILWFDYWLKGIDNGIMSEKKARLFIMGADRWMDTDCFPVPGAAETVFYLQTAGPSNSLYGNGRLIRELPEQNNGNSSKYVYNPERPAPTPFWKENFQNGTNEDLRPIQRRDDVLVFTSAPLEEDLTVAGCLTAELFVSTNVPDTDFIARISDVAPDGYAQRLNHGILRLRYRDGYSQIKLASPGEIMKINVDMWATGHQFKKGHSIRLDITSSAFPTWAPNYNTGGNIWYEIKPIIAEQAVYHSHRYPSRIILPEIKNPEFTESWTEKRWKDYGNDLKECI